MALLPTDSTSQKRLLIGLIPLLGLFAYHQLVYGKKVQEAESLEMRLDQLSAANNAAKVLAAQGGPELERRLAIYEQHMRELEELIPKREEVAELLHQMTVRAQTSGMDLTGMKPEAEDAGPYYTRGVYEITVKGPYHAIGTFLTEIGSLPRIVTPTQLKIVVPRENPVDRKGMPIVEANFRIVTYLIPEPAAVPADSGAAANVSN